MLDHNYVNCSILKLHIRNTERKPKCIPYSVMEVYEVVLVLHQEIP